MAVGGLTCFNCAQATTNKVRPVSQEEFFRLFAFFNQSEDNDQGDDRPSAIFTDEPEEAKKKDWGTSSRSCRRRSTPSDAGAGGGAGRSGRTGFAQPSNGAAHGSGDRGAESRASSGATTCRRSRPCASAYAAAGASTSRASPTVRGSRRSEGPKAKIVRIDLPGTVLPAFAEVQVFSGADNIALKGQGEAGSTDFGGDAKRAIDGNTNGDYKRGLGLPQPSRKTSLVGGRSRAGVRRSTASSLEPQRRRRRTASRDEELQALAARRARKRSRSASRRTIRTRRRGTFSTGFTRGVKSTAGCMSRRGLAARQGHVADLKVDHPCRAASDPATDDRAGPAARRRVPRTQAC